MHEFGYVNSTGMMGVARISRLLLAVSLAS